MSTGTETRGELLLVVEDPTTRQLLAAHLSLDNYGVVSESRIDAANPDDFDVVIADVRESDALRLVHRADAATTPVIALLADAGSERKRLLDRGIAATVTKPFHYSELLPKIDELLPHQEVIA